MIGLRLRGAGSRIPSAFTAKGLDGSISPPRHEARKGRMSFFARFVPLRFIKSSAGVTVFDVDIGVPWVAAPPR